MPRVIKSPVERWKGTITLCEPLTIEQAVAIDDAKEALYAIEPSKFLVAVTKKEGMVWGSKHDQTVIPAILLCVEKWDLQDFSIEPQFPGSPRGDVHKLVGVIWEELEKVYNGEQQIPNE